MPSPTAVERALAVIERHEPVLRAWAHLDPARALAEEERAPPGPLAGLTVGVKDIFDTADQPTSYGSALYAGFRPVADAAAVALLRAAGAVVVGKTVTAELAWFTPGPTTNPHRATHTPGGSSSGSAAAVGARMVDLALGTQTAGSVIRPASFCGVFGYKPTFGAIPTAGVKQAAPSLDTVGLFAADLDVLDAARVVLTGQPPAPAARPATARRFAFVRTEQWGEAEADCRQAVERAAAAVDATERPLPLPLAGLAADQSSVQAYEGARALAWEQRRPGLSEPLRGLLDRGAAVSYDFYRATLDRARLGRSDAVVDQLFGESDVLVTPAAPGEAPEGLSSTGDPRFCRLWTLLGFPALTVPGLVGRTGLPIGIQLVARPHHDHVLVAAGRHLATVLAG